jgi:nucleotide-binding universal stress UspA family protein
MANGAAPNLIRDLTPNREKQTVYKKGSTRWALGHSALASRQRGPQGGEFSIQPAAEILDIAQKKPDNVVAIATHGRTGIKPWLLGSVTEHVIGHATGPMLMIRAS